MTHVVDLDRVTPTTPSMATGYVRTGLSALEPAPEEGPGWSFGAGQIVTTASDLARWDIGLMSGALLPAQLVWSHVGQGLGFLAGNTIYPGEEAAIVVLTNTSATLSFAHITDRIAFLLLQPTPADARARALITSLQNGSVDGVKLTPEFKAYLNPARLGVYQASLAPVGEIKSLILKSEDTADGVTTRRYEAIAGERRLSIIWEELADGFTDDFNVQPAVS